MDGILRIDSDKAARAWLTRLRAAYFSKATPAVEFALPYMAEAENRSLTREAGKLRNACGCSQAGFAMTVTLLAIAYRFATDGVPLAATPWSSWIVAALAVGAAASLAKVVALMFAHRRLTALAEQICMPHEISKELTPAEY